MIETNDIRLAVPYSINRVKFVQQFHTFAKERKIERSNKTLADFKTILGPKATKIFEPDMHQALLNRDENLRAIAAGLERDPPVIIGAIAINPNLPENPPITQEEIPQTAVAIKKWEIENERCTDFHKAKTELKKRIKSLLDNDIFNTLVTKAGMQGWANVEPADVFEYILGDEFGDISENELQIVLDRINQPWDKSKTLKANLEAMVKENDALGDSFPHLKLTDQALFRSAFSIAKRNTYRLLPIVNNFMLIPGQGHTKSLFPDFSAYLLLHYPNYGHDANTNHLAFSGENALQDNNPLHFGLAAVEPVALAVTSPRNISNADWAEFQDYQAKKLAVKEKPPVVGKLCFFHGWNKSHDSTQCKRMIHDSKYTAAQKAFIKIPRNKNVVIDGVQCNVACGQGVVPAP